MAENTIKPYRPLFFDGFKSEPVEFSTLDELLSIPFVKNFTMGNFSHFVISDNYLMAVYDDGLKWWVVGTIEFPEKVNLPVWQCREELEGPWEAVWNTISKLRIY